MTLVHKSAGSSCMQKETYLFRASLAGSQLLASNSPLSHTCSRIYITIKRSSTKSFVPQALALDIAHLLQLIERLGQQIKILVQHTALATATSSLLAVVRAKAFAADSETSFEHQKGGLMASWLSQQGLLVTAVSLAVQTGRCFSSAAIAALHIWCGLCLTLTSAVLFVRRPPISFLDH